ncbi:MAG: hypothetical protein ABI413_11435 [Ktedonobacteraceae bacterium]
MVGQTATLIQEVRRAQVEVVAEIIPAIVAVVVAHMEGEVMVVVVEVVLADVIS